MKITHDNIFSELERLGAAFPWDEVAIWTRRSPEGIIRFTAFIDSNDKLGLYSNSMTSANLSDMVNDIIEEYAKKRDPEVARQRRVEELKEKLARLESVVFDMPPYRPNRELSNGATTILDTINI